jgi:hypothetical protein
VSHASIGTTPNQDRGTIASVIAACLMSSLPLRCLSREGLAGKGRSDPFHRDPLRRHAQCGCPPEGRLDPPVARNNVKSPSRQHATRIIGQPTERIRDPGLSRAIRCPSSAHPRPAATCVFTTSLPHWISASTRSSMPVDGQRRDLSSRRPSAHLPSSVEPGSTFLSGSDRADARRPRRNMRRHHLLSASASTSRSRMSARIS